MEKPQQEFKPYISPSDLIPEFTPRAIILGAFFGIIFGAATCYLGLKVGLTVSASIPIAVLAISIFKKFGKASILESNMVQTIGSAGESVGSGVVFTVPALLFLSGGIDYFHYFQIFVLALCGGILGVLFMVPLRRSLIVKEHGNLPYPEGTACADVLIAGEKGGNLAKKVYIGLGVAFLYKLLMSILCFWKDVPTYIMGKKSSFPNASVSGEITPELLGVGYIIGPRIAGIMVAGGILSYWVLIPLFTFIGDGLTSVLNPGTGLVSDMGPDEIRAAYIRYIGAGAVTFGGIMTLIKTIPTIVSAFGDSFKDFKNRKNDASSKKLRTEKDIPISVVLIGSLVLVVLMAVLPGIPGNILSSLMIIVFGFFFVTVSSRVVGLIGSSSNPISGMTIAALMATSLIFVGLGWTGDIYQPIALCVGSIVCIAAANAGATSQDLKTGFLLGATPYRQQFGLMIGVLASVVSIGLTLLLLNDAFGIGIVTEEHKKPLPAPQAMLMATVIKGLLGQKLPWALVLVGMSISAVVELCGISSLAFAVGAYLPLSSSTPIFVGGAVKWLVDRKKKVKEDSEIGPGALYSSGLIAGGALTGILIAALTAIKMGEKIGENGKTETITLISKFNTGFIEYMDQNFIGGNYTELLSLACFLGLAYTLYHFGKMKPD